MTEPQLAISVPGKGRMYRHPVNDQLYPSVTNVIEVLAKPWLANWKAKMVAGHAWDMREVLAQIPDRDAAVDMLKGGPQRQRDAAASLGDLIHRYAECVARNEPPPEIPTEHEGFVEAFLEFLEEYRPRFRVLEGIIFSGRGDDPLRYAGAFDFLADIPAISETSARWLTLLGDYKTSPAVYDEAALQLAALRNADEVWDEATGELGPLPHIDGCIAVNLRPNQLKVHILDAGDQAHEAFMGLRQAWPWTKDNTRAVGPQMNLVRLVKELAKPTDLAAQLQASLESVEPALD